MVSYCPSPGKIVVTRSESKVATTHQNPSNQIQVFLPTVSQPENKGRKGKSNYVPFDSGKQPCSVSTILYITTTNFHLDGIIKQNSTSKSKQVKFEPPSWLCIKKIFQSPNHSQTWEKVYKTKRKNNKVIFFP